MGIKKKTYLELFCSAVILLFCEFFFFRNVVGTGTGALIGDQIDGRLTTLLAEHWWKFFNGKEAFSEIAMFYPREDVFGYTDLFLGYGIVYSVLRFVGINMYVAYKWTIVLFHAFGTATMYYLLRHKLNVGFLWSIFGTMSFCFSDTFARHLEHTQLGAISCLPLLLILFCGFINNIEIRYKRNLYAYCFIVWFVLLTYNSWYVACFTGLFCLIFIVVYFIVLKGNIISFVVLLKQKMAIIWKDLIGYALVMGVLYIPFIRIYLPVMRASSGYSYDACRDYLPEFIDIINVSESNFMLGKIIELLKLSSRGYSSEVTEGFSIVLLAFFFSTWLLHKHRNAADITKEGETTVFKEVAIGAVFVTIITGILCIIRLSSNGTSMWYIIYKLVPVVRSMRAIARFLLWLSFPMAVVTAYSADKYLRFKKKYMNLLVACAAVILIFVSNINRIGVYQFWNYPDQYNFVSNVATPPEDLECFYIIDTAQVGDRPEIYQLDAFEIATTYSVKTINGYSGQYPDNWRGIWDACAGCYEGSVFGWVNEYGLENVYAYDRATNIWIPINERYLPAMDDVFCPEDNKFSISRGLIELDQRECCWMSREFETKINNSKIKDSGLNIKMNLTLSYYLAQNPEIDPYLNIYVDGQLLKEVEVIDGYVEINIPVNEHEGDIYDVQIKTNCFFNPKNIGLNEDARDLSFGLYYIGD